MWAGIAGGTFWSTEIAIATEASRTENGSRVLEETKIVHGTLEM